MFLLPIMCTLAILTLVSGLVFAFNDVGILTKEGHQSWVIKQGKHFANWDWFPVVLKKRKPGQIYQVAFTVNETMTYDLHSDDDNDWNKLVGEGSLILDTLKKAWKRKVAPHHINSWRVGWCCDPATQQIKLALYWYNDGFRYSQQIYEYTWRPGLVQEFTLEVIPQEAQTEFRLYTNQVALVLDDTSYGTTNKLVSNITVGQAITGWTYRLRPYFGGNQTAPHKMHVWYRFLG